MKKKDIHNIKRDYNISYATRRHDNDATSVNLWVKEMIAKGDESPILYFKEQGNSDDNVQRFTKDDFCLIIMTQFQSELLIKFGNDKICIDGNSRVKWVQFSVV